MGLEIERKFLPVNENWKAAVADVPGEYILQGYISTRKEAVVRIRIIGERAFLTLKGANILNADMEHGAATRAEFEYPVPVEDARAMLQTLLAFPALEKIRYRVPLDGLIWEVDEFLGAYAGLVLIEVELTHGAQAFCKPDWVGEEVSMDSRYSNAVLAQTVGEAKDAV